MPRKQSAAMKQKNSIKAKQRGLSANNPLKTANLVKYADVLGIDENEWHTRMIRSRAIKAALQHNLLETAVNADIEGLLTEAIQERSVEKADLLERILKCIGAVYRDQQPGVGTQVNISTGGDPSKPLSVKFVDAQEVKPDEPVEDK